MTRNQLFGVIAFIVLAHSCFFAGSTIGEKLQLSALSMITLMNMKRVREQGFTLISVMVAAAIFSIIALAIMSLMADMASYSQRSNSVAGVDTAMKIAANVLVNKDMCDHALRKGSTSTKLVSTLSAAPETIDFDIFNVHTTTPAVSNKPLFDLSSGAPQAITGNQNLLLTKMRFIECGSKDGSGNPLIADCPAVIQGQVTLFDKTAGPSGAPVTYKTKAGVVDFQFDLAAQRNSDPTKSRLLLGGQLKGRQIPITLAIKPDGTVDRCYYDSSFGQLCAQVGGQMNDVSGNCEMTAKCGVDFATDPQGMKDKVIAAYPACSAAGCIFYASGVGGGDALNWCRCVCPTGGTTTSAPSAVPSSPTSTTTAPPTSTTTAPPTSTTTAPPTSTTTAPPTTSTAPPTTSTAPPTTSTAPPSTSTAPPSTGPPGN